MLVRMAKTRLALSWAAILLHIHSLTHSLSHSLSEANITHTLPKSRKQCLCLVDLMFSVLVWWNMFSLSLSLSLSLSFDVGLVSLFARSAADCQHLGVSWCVLPASVPFHLPHARSTFPARRSTSLAHSLPHITSIHLEHYVQIQLTFSLSVLVSPLSP